MAVNNVKDNIRPGLQVPSQVTGELRDYLESVKEILESYGGDRGVLKERFATIKELEQAGIISTYTARGRAEVNVSPTVATQILSNPVALQVPDALTNFTATDSFGFNDAGEFKVDIELSWTASPNAFVFQYEIRYLLAPADDWTSIVISTDSVKWTLADATPNGVYDFQIRAVNAIGVFGPWATIEDHTASNEVRVPDEPRFFDGFGEYDDLAAYEKVWTITTAGLTTVSFPENGQFGGKVMQVSEQMLTVWSKPGTLNLPFDPEQLYKLTVTIRKTVNQTSGVANSFIGLAGIAADGVTAVNINGADSYGSQHYMAFSSEDIASGTDWITREVYIKGTAATGDLNNSAGELYGSPLDPAVLHEDVRFVRPIIYFNWPGSGSLDATYEIDTFLFEPTTNDLLGLVEDTFFGEPIANDATHTIAPWTYGNVSQVPTLISGETENALEIGAPGSGGAHTDKVSIANRQRFEVTNREWFRTVARLRRPSAGIGDWIDSPYLSFGVSILVSDAAGQGSVSSTGTFLWEDPTSEILFSDVMPLEDVWYDVSFLTQIDVSPAAFPTTARMFGRVNLFVGIPGGGYNARLIHVDSVNTFRASPPFVGPGTTGSVPNPKTGYTGTRVLREDGTWAGGTFAGYVDAAATGNNLPSGWSAMRNAAGDYTVTHDLSLGDVDDLSICITPVTTLPVYTRVEARTTSTFDVFFRNVNNTVNIDSAFNILARLIT